MSSGFVQNTDFSAYVTYCKNKPTSDNARVEYEAFFSKRQNELGQKLNIEDLLITPVQRLPKYQLLIRVSMWAFFVCMIINRNYTYQSNYSILINDAFPCLVLTVLHMGT